MTSATRLPRSARVVEVRPLCNGGCPEGSLRTLARRRSGPELSLRGTRAVLHSHASGDADDGANCCSGTGPASDVMALIAAEDEKSGPYVPCPCGSGKKFRFCHGDRAPQSPLPDSAPSWLRRTMQKLSRCTPNSHAEHRPATRRELLSNSAAVLALSMCFFSGASRQH